MKNNALINITIFLIAAILGVIGYKLSPMFRPNAELTLPAVSCNSGNQPCFSSLPEGGRVDIFITPHPVRPLQKLGLRVEFTAFKADKVEIDFDGAQMRMGYNRPLLVGSNGLFSGQTILPVCVTGRMEWVATVLITVGNRRIAVPFLFDVAAR